MKKKVMVVDDNPELTDMIEKKLKHLDDQYEIITAKSGKECFELLKKGTMPDLILYDIMIHERDSWDILINLRRELADEKIPIVFLSSDNTHTNGGLGIITNEGYTTKPVMLCDLKERLDKIFEHNDKDTLS